VAQKRAAKKAKVAYFRFVAAMLKGKTQDPRKTANRLLRACGLEEARQIAERAAKARDPSRYIWGAINRQERKPEIDPKVAAGLSFDGDIGREEAERRSESFA
jgi:hypothetical protein